MSTSRGHRVLKGRTVFYMVVILCTISVIYLYQSFNQSNENSKLLHQKCLVEKSSLSSQFQELDQFIPQLKEEIARLKQKILSQNQQDATLMDRCKKLEFSLETITALRRIEEKQLEELKNTHKELLHKVQALERENTLLKQNTAYQILPVQIQEASYQKTAIAEDKNFSKQIEVIQDEFNLNFGTNSAKEETGKKAVQGKSLIAGNEDFVGDDKPVQNSNQSAISSTTPKLEQMNIVDKVELPDGVAPELFVDEISVDKSAKHLDDKIPKVEALTAVKSVLKPPNRYEVKLGEDKVMQEIINNQDVFQEDNPNNLPGDSDVQKRQEKDNNNPDFNDVNLSLDQAEPANNLEEDEDDYDGSKMDFGGVNRN